MRARIGLRPRLADCVPDVVKDIRTMAAPHRAMLLLYVSSPTTRKVWHAPCQRRGHDFPSRSFLRTAYQRWLHGHLPGMSASEFAEGPVLRRVRSCHPVR